MADFITLEQLGVKRCPRCKQVHLKNEYWRRGGRRGDALRPYCKSCDRKRDRQRQKDAPERHRANQRRYSHRHPERGAATRAVAYAIKKGRLVRMPCEACGEKAEAHHDDYSKPLAVRWLCRPHHMQHHAAA